MFLHAIDKFIMLTEGMANYHFDDDEKCVVTLLFKDKRIKIADTNPDVIAKRVDMITSTYWLDR